jgi:hypothetical protein
VPDYLRGRTIELRYDPFDLSQLELWFQDTFLQRVQPDQLVTPIHPDLTPDPSPTPPPTNTGLDYLALLRLEHDRLIQAQLQGIHFSQLTDRTPPEKSAAQTRLDTPDQEASHDRPE